jgi:hypothetical protein
MANLSGDITSSTGVLLRDGPMPYEDTPAEAYISLDYWNSLAREAVVKSRHEEAYRVPPDRTQCLPRYFADAMLAEGCIRVKTWHVRFTGLSAECVNIFPSEVVYAPSLTFEGPRGKVPTRIVRPLGGSGSRRQFKRRSDTPTGRPQTRYHLRNQQK